MFRSKTAYLLHITCWLLFMAFPLLFLNRDNIADYSPWPILSTASYWLYGFTYLCIFYLNTLVFIPRYFIKKRYMAYALVLVLMLASIYFVRPFDKLINSSERIHPAGAFYGPPTGMPWQYGGHMPPPPPHNGGGHRMAFTQPNARMRPPMHGAQHLDMTSLFIYVMIIATGMAVSSVQQWLITERRVIQMEADKTNAELSFLKAQINPHFLFNTLNNIYTLAITDHAHTAASIMKLSNLMRYLTDEVSADLVPLQQEVNIIYDYLDLQRLRIGGNTIIDLNVTGDLDGHKVPPLILMSFIENIFKYGISKREVSTIRIQINAESHQLTFFCQNKIFTGPAPIERVGIGIANSRQRLQYLYGDEHQLHIDSQNGLFTVSLTIPV